MVRSSLLNGRQDLRGLSSTWLRTVRVSPYPSVKKPINKQPKYNHAGWVKVCSWLRHLNYGLQLTIVIIKHHTRENQSNITVTGTHGKPSIRGREVFAQSNQHPPERKTDNCLHRLGPFAAYIVQRPEWDWGGFTNHRKGTPCRKHYFMGGDGKSSSKLPCYPWLFKAMKRICFLGCVRDLAGLVRIGEQLRISLAGPYTDSDLL